MSNTLASPPSRSSGAARWAAGSLAVVVPVGASATSPLSSVVTEVWDLKGLRRRSTHQPLSTPNRVVWDTVADPQFVGALLPERYLHQRSRQNGPPPVPEAEALLSPLPPGAAALSGLELMEYDALPGRPAGTYLVLHVELAGVGLDDPTAVAAYFAHPTRPGKQAEELAQPRRRLDHTALDALTRALGLPPAVRDGSAHARAYRPYVISHLVPRTDSLPDPGLRPHTAGGPLPSPAQAWAWRMAAGTNLSIDREVAGERSRDGFWLGSSWCHVSATGLAVIGTRGIDELPTSGADREGSVWWLQDARQNVEHTALEGYTHRHAVDFAILALRQADFLRGHAARLPDVWREQEASALHRRAADLQQELLVFRNRTWFTQVPEDPALTDVVRHLHRALGTAELFSEVYDEQKEQASALALRAQEEQEHRAAEARALAEESARRERERADADKARLAQEAAHAEVEAARQQRLERAVTVLAAGLAAPTFVFGWASLQDDPVTLGPTAATAVAILLAVLIATLVLWFAQRVETPGSRTGADRPRP